MFFGRKTTMVSADEALPGRDDRMPVAERHVVLDTPLTGPWPAGHEVISFGMGCFWGVERIFWQIPGVYSTAAGYQGGYTPNPTYEEASTSRTGHAEAVQVVYDPTRVDIEVLLKAFWENHDPTTPNQQGNDVGTQYRSAIYPTTDAQLAAAEASRTRYQQALKEAGYGDIATEIRPASAAPEAGLLTCHATNPAHPPR
ncbi:MAG: peptide-methionine (S)-S-oxide reductase MsrA, partial [Actinomycetes bacterium]